jgi:hypothetical protein
MWLFARTLFSCLMLAGTVAAVFWVSFTDPPSYFSILQGSAAEGFVALVLIGSSFYWFALTVEGAARCWRLLHCHLDHHYLECAVRDLDSPSPSRRRQALCTVADFHQHPLRIFARDLPAPTDALQLPVLALLHREWLQTHRSRTQRTRTSLQEIALGLRRRVREMRWRLFDALRDRLVSWGVIADPQGPGPGLSPLPPVAEEAFLQVMRDKITGTLEIAADAINAAPNEEVVSASAERVRDCFAALQRDAVATGLQMRLDAAAADTLDSSALQLEIPRGSRKKALFELRHRMEETLEWLGDALHEAILDWGMPDPPALPMLPFEPLPQMERESFLEAMRRPVEDAMRRVAEVLSTAPLGALERTGEQRLHDLFVNLQLEALEVGLQLRLDVWEAELPPVLEPQHASEAPLPLRKAADPRLPPSQACRLRWAEKFRRMRAAGTRWPPSRESLGQ